MNTAQRVLSIRRCRNLGDEGHHTEAKMPAGRRVAGALAGALVSLVVASPAAATFTIGASTTAGASNTCTITAVKPALSSGYLSGSFTVKCTVKTTLSYSIQLRESDFSAGYNTVVNLSSSFYVANAGVTYTVASTTAQCTSTTPLGSGANTETSREEVYTYVAAAWGGYNSRAEQTAVPAENSTASFAC